MSGTGSALLLGITLCCLGAWAKENIGEYHYVCPKFHSESCKVPNPRGCHGDQYCPKGQKCCCSDCGWKCVTAERVKPGRCPPIMPRCVGPPPKPSCQTDGDCSGRQKCCTLCGKERRLPDAPKVLPVGGEAALHARLRVAPPFNHFSTQQGVWPTE
uniref:WAP domain-containing protein n=1 Tax=Xenopus tropicalis TaxID=8364 RepID=A0A1B8XVG0_XENTR